MISKKWLIIIIVLILLYLMYRKIFKPKEPTVTAAPGEEEHAQWLNWLGM